MFVQTMEERDVRIEDFPIPGQMNPIVMRQDPVDCTDVSVAEIPMLLDHLLRYSSQEQLGYHEIIAQEAIKQGLHDNVESKAHEDSPDTYMNATRPQSPVRKAPRSRSSEIERTLKVRSEARSSEEQITCNDFLRESYPPSLIDASQSSSSDESTASCVTSLDLAQARALRNSSSTLTPSKQRWRLSSHRSSHSGKDYQSKPVDPSKLYKRLKDNFRGASLRSYTTRSPSTSSNSSSQEALQSLQKCSEKNLTALNLQELQISDPQYSRSTLEYCEEKISTWPCGSAQQKYLMNELSLSPQALEEVVTHHHFVPNVEGEDEDDREIRQRQLSRFSWSTIYTTHEEQQKSWHKKLFKRPIARAKIPEWLTGYDV